MHKNDDNKISMTLFSTIIIGLDQSGNMQHQTFLYNRQQQQQGTVNTQYLIHPTDIISSLLGSSIQHATWPRD